MGVIRLLKVLLTALLAVFAVFAGLFVTLAVAVTGAAVLLVRRLLRSSRNSPANLPPRTAPRHRAPTDAIEVTATEVPAEPPPQLK